MAQYTIKLMPPAGSPTITKNGSDQVQKVIQELLSMYKIEPKLMKQSFYLDSNCTKPAFDKSFDMKTTLSNYFSNRRFVIYVKKAGGIQQVTSEDFGSTQKPEVFQDNREYTQEDIQFFTEIERQIATTTHRVKDSSCSHDNKNPCLKCLEKNKERILKENNISPLEFERFLLYKNAGSSATTRQANINDVRLKTQQQIVLKPEQEYKWPTLFFASHTLNAFYTFLIKDQHLDDEFYFACYGRDNVVMYIDIVPFSRLESGSCVTTPAMWEVMVSKYQAFSGDDGYQMDIIGLGMHTPRHLRFPRDLLLHAAQKGIGTVILSYPDNQLDPKQLQTEDEFKARFKCQNQRTRTIQATVDGPAKRCDTFNFIVHGVGQQIQFISDRGGIASQTTRNMYSICLSQPVIINEQFLTEIDVECFLTPPIGVKSGRPGDDFIYGKVPQHVLSWQDYVKLVVMDEEQIKERIPELITKYSGSLCRDVQFQQLLNSAGIMCLGEQENAVKQRVSRFLETLSN